MHEQLGVKGKHPSWKNSVVRLHCRRTNDHRPKRCEVCGYDKHVEFAHVRGLASFQADATLAEVNDPSNVRILCRNHHWELDHGMLDEP